jgi:hypothetical protein
MPDDSGSGLSRRQVLAASGSGLLAATTAGSAGAGTARRPSHPGDGTPEQIHLTWGDDPAKSVVVSWASPEQAKRPRVRIGQRVILAEERAYTDGLNGQTTWTYHARVPGLRPGATYGYAVTAENDGNAADPFSATFTTAPEGRAAFRFTSFGNLGTPNTTWVASYGQAAYAVGAVESFQPLFHLLNGDLCYASLNPAAQPEVWRDFGSNNQASAANRPWMPVPGDHEIEFGNGPQGLTSYLTRYTLPANGLGQFEGRWYSFRIGSALFVSLSANDVVYQDAGPFVPGPTGLTPAAGTGGSLVPAGPRCTCAATRAARRPGGWRPPWRRRGGTPRSTGSSRRCITAPARPRAMETALTWASGRSGCRFSTSTRWTWCSAGTTTATSGRSPSAGSTLGPAPTW